jgi:hypothetical protein
MPLLLQKALDVISNGTAAPRRSSRSLPESGCLLRPQSTSVPRLPTAPCPPCAVVAAPLDEAARKSRYLDARPITAIQYRHRNQERRALPSNFKCTTPTRTTRPRPWRRRSTESGPDEL